MLLKVRKFLQLQGFLSGVVIGIVGLFVMVSVVDWLQDTTTLWFKARRERIAANMLIDAIENKTLQCTSGPLRFEHSAVDVRVVVIPRGPLKSVIEVSERANNIILHTVYIQTFAPIGITISNPWVQGDSSGANDED